MVRNIRLTLGLNPISLPRGTPAPPCQYPSDNQGRWMGEQHHQWYDPNLSAGPTQGGRTDTETHPWFYGLWGEQPTCAMLV